MPKKFVGENTKAVAAKARKANALEEERLQKKKEVEDAMWHDGDKHIQKKQQRKEEQERRKQEVAGRKAENKAILEQEMKTLKNDTGNISLPPPTKLTRAHISDFLTKVTKKDTPQPVVTHVEEPLEENLNRVVIEGEHAHTVAEAIAVLSVKDEELDKHPEKRMKAAYTAYEEKRLKELKDENTTLRLSQLKQLIFREWQKSPENPLNK